MHEHCGFIGLGLMGRRMAARLLQHQVPLVLWNRTASRCTPLLAAGARQAATPAALAARSTLIMTCLADDAALDAVLHGPDGVLAGIRPGSLLVDFSSVTPALATRLATELAERGAHGIDAPVSGGTRGAEDGTLIMMAGGRQEDIDRFAPIGALLARRITRMGPAGTGQLTKLCNQLIVAANAVLITEAVRLAEAGGVDPTRLAPALADGFADSRPLQILAPRMAERRFTPLEWKVATLEKDLRNACQAANALGLPLPLALAAARQLGQAAAMRGEEDLSTLILQEPETPCCD